MFKARGIKDCKHEFGVSLVSFIVLLSSQCLPKILMDSKAESSRMGGSTMLVTG